MNQLPNDSAEGGLRLYEVGFCCVNDVSQGGAGGNSCGNRPGYKLRPLLIWLFLEVGVLFGGVLMTGAPKAPDFESFI